MTDMPTIEEYMAMAEAMHDESDLCNADYAVPFAECATREPDIEDAVRVLVALRREGWRMVRDATGTIPLGLEEAS